MRSPLARFASIASIASVAGLALLLAAPVSAQQGKMDETNNPADAAFIAAMRDFMVGMHRSMPTGDTDRDFVRLMLPYSQSALDMAKAEVKYGQDADIKAMAQKVIDDQDRQIAMMKAWEAKHAK